MRYVGLAVMVTVVFGAFNAAGDIGPAIGHMLGAKDGDYQLTRFGDRGIPVSYTHLTLPTKA